METNANTLIVSEGRTNFGLYFCWVVLFQVMETLLLFIFCIYLQTV